jgi:putative hemolysin
MFLQPEMRPLLIDPRQPAVADDVGRRCARRTLRSDERANSFWSGAGTPAGDHRSDPWPASMEARLIGVAQMSDWISSDCETRLFGLI